MADVPGPLARVSCPGKPSVPCRVQLVRSQITWLPAAPGPAPGGSRHGRGPRNTSPFRADGGSRRRPIRSDGFEPTPIHMARRRNLAARQVFRGLSGVFASLPCWQRQFGAVWPRVRAQTSRFLRSPIPPSRATGANSWSGKAKHEPRRVPPINSVSRRSPWIPNHCQSM